MTYVLLRSSAFVREAQKIIKKYPQIAQNRQKTLEVLSTEPFHPLEPTTKFIKQT